MRANYNKADRAKRPKK